MDVRPIERWLIGARLCRVGQQQRVNGVLRLSHVQDSGSARNNGMNRPERLGENNLRRAFDD